MMGAYLITLLPDGTIYTDPPPEAPVGTLQSWSDEEGVWKHQKGRVTFWNTTDDSEDLSRMQAVKLLLL